MKIILKCGVCDHKYSITLDRAKAGTFGKFCPNCEAKVPVDVCSFATALANMKSHPNTEKWEVFNLPDELSTDAMLLTLQLK